MKITISRLMEACLIQSSEVQNANLVIKIGIDGLTQTPNIFKIQE